MASPFAASALPVVRQEDDKPRLPPIQIDLSDADPATTMQDGAAVTEQPDGSVTIDLSGNPARKPKSNKFAANLAEEMEDAELNVIASDLLEGIARDESSRGEHLQMLADGLKLLGLVLESNSTTSVASSAPLEGMSTVRHPLLLEACQLFQANALGELLPAAGPVKVRDDRPQKPKDADSMLGHNGGPQLDGVSPFTTPQASPGASQPPLPPVLALPAPVPCLFPLVPGCSHLARPCCSLPLRRVLLPVVRCPVLLLLLVRLRCLSQCR